jgi:hypothetical protein
VFCDGISTCFSDPSFNNNGEFVLGEEPVGWSIFINDYFVDNPDDELMCGIYVGVDSGTCSTSSGVQVGNVGIKKDSVMFWLNPGSVASSFQLYAGKCEGSDFGTSLLSESGDIGCDSSDVREYAGSPVSYPLNAILDSSATSFAFTVDNQQAYTKPHPWGDSGYNVFSVDLSERKYLSIHADVCESVATRRDRALQANAHASKSLPSWPPNLQPRGPTYHASSSPSRFPTSSPISIRSVPPSKFPTATPSSLPSSEPKTLPTTVPIKFPSSWPTNLPTCRSCEFDTE